MKDFKKYVAEFFGTMMLVIFGCGSAVAINKLLMIDVVQPLGVSTLLIAFAFGLVVMAMAYTVGHVSGCHINPAVSLGVYLTGKMSTHDFIKYVISQMLGGIVGAAILVIIFNSNASLGANGFGELSALNIVWYRAFIVEVIYALIFKRNSFKVYIKESYSIFPGLFLAMILPLNIPVYMLIIGVIVATLSKLVFGGFGKNLFNPALVGYLFVVLAQKIAGKIKYGKSLYS